MAETINFEADVVRQAPADRTCGGTGRGTLMQFTNRVALLTSVLLLSMSAVAQVTGTSASPWLPDMERQLFERSFGRCLKASYLKQGVRLSELRIASALSNDLDQYSGSLTVDDVRQAPRESIDGQQFIQCSWFTEGTQVR